ncbi:MAG: diguanylate cyclase [Proteobacteria bacterium]|nr:MAG: diguanylate cyclase [Pseudomonadota bacterium]
MLMSDFSFSHQDNRVLPKDEKARLATLSSYRILDTLPEKAFDDLTALAAQICNTPISLVTLIDNERQWFKSKLGLGMSQSHRIDSFCAHALYRPDEILIVPDAHLDSRFFNNPLVTEDPFIRFYMGAPLVAPTGEVLGNLCVIDIQPRQPTLDQQKCLQALARQTMAQLELRRRNIELTDQMALRVQTEAILRESEEQFQAFMNHSPLVAFIKDDRGRYTYVNPLFLDRLNLNSEQVIGHNDFELWPDIAPQLVERDRRVLAGEKNIATVERAISEEGDINYWQIFKFPLQRGGGNRRMVAGIGLDITKNKLYEEKLQAYQRQLEETLEKVKAQSLEDGLTGLFNRRAFDLKIAEEVDRAKRYNLPFSLLMIDVDNFKAFNDNFGHPEGDEVLRTLAQIFKEETRPHDFVARYGGEEFVLILPNTGYDGAFFLAERFRRSILSHAWHKRPITVSIGTATSNSSLATPQALIEAADGALYEAKRAGRNLVSQAAL